MDYAICHFNAAISRKSIIIVLFEIAVTGGKSDKSISYIIQHTTISYIIQHTVVITPFVQILNFATEIATDKL